MPQELDEKIKATWTSREWLWSAHLAADLTGASIRSTRRALARLERDGWIRVYGRNLSAGKTLYERMT